MPRSKTQVSNKGAKSDPAGDEGTATAMGRRRN